MLYVIDISYFRTFLFQDRDIKSIVYIDVQPIVYADMFGSVGSARYDCGFTFVSKVAFDSNIKEKYGIERNILPVKNCRNITKKDMKYNDVVEKIEVDSETYEVKVNGVKITSKPVSKVSLGQLYTLF